MGSSSRARKKKLNSLNKVTSAALNKKKEVSKDLLTGFSDLWDNNPKLLQIIDTVSKKAENYILENSEAILEKALRILSEKDQKKFTDIWTAYQEKGIIPDLASLIFSGYSATLLKIYLEKGNHWLNQKEVDFVQESWEKRIQEITQLKQERDEAIKAKELAEFKTREAQATAFAAQARQISLTNPTVALNLAFVAYQMMPSQANLAAYNEIKDGSPKYKKSYSGHFGNVTALAFSLDGKFMIVGNSNIKNAIMIVEVETKKIIRDFQGHSIWTYAIEISPDGDTFFTCGRNSVKLWNFKTGKLIRSFTVPKDHLTCMALSRKEKLMISGSHNQSIKLWNIETGQLIRSFLHAAIVRSVTFSPNGKMILSGGYDKTAKLWNVKTGQLIKTISDPLSGISAVAFAPKQSYIITGGDDGRVKKWDITTGKDISPDRFLRHDSRINKLIFSPDGRYILSASDDKTAKLWDNITGYETTLKGHTASVDAIAFSSDSRSILTGSYDKTIKLWETEQLKSEDTAIIRHREGIREAVFSPDNAFILAGGHPNVAILWDAITLKKNHSFNGHRNTVSSVVFSKDGQYIATGSWDNMIIIWSIESKKIIRKISSGSAQSIVFSPDGQHLLTSSGNTAILWNLKTGSPVVTYRGHKSAVGQAIFSPNGQQIVTASYDDTLKLWDLNNEKALHTFKGHSDRVTCVAFSSDASLILSGSFDNTAILWDMETKKIQHTFIGHGATVSVAAFSPDNQLVLTGSADQTAVLWDIQTGKSIRTFQHQRPLVSVHFSSNGRSILTASLDSTIKLWKNHLTNWPSVVYKLNEEERKQYGIEIDY